MITPMVHTPLKPLPRFAPGANPFTPGGMNQAIRVCTRGSHQPQGGNTPAWSAFFCSFLDWTRRSPHPNSCRFRFFTRPEPKKGSFRMTSFRVQLGCNSHRHIIQNTQNGLSPPPDMLPNAPCLPHLYGMGRPDSLPARLRIRRLWSRFLACEGGFTCPAKPPVVLSKPPKVFRVNRPSRWRFTPGFRRCLSDFCKNTSGETPGLNGGGGRVKH